MLTHIQIANFALIKSLSLELQPQLTVITGETGAGKSIIIDALSLALGARADSAQIGTHGERCEITATFQIAANTQAQQWLSDYDFDTSSGECMLSRVISSNGRSRSLINGRPGPIQLTRDLARLLVIIHSQNQHINLTKLPTQRQLLDHYAKHQALCDTVSELYQQWQHLRQEAEDWQKLTQDQDAQQQLLAYHLQELEELAVNAGEIEELHQQHRQAQHSTDIQHVCHAALEQLQDTPVTNASALLSSTQADLQKQLHLAPELQGPCELLNQAHVLTQEACADIQHTLSSLTADPEALQHMEERLQAIYATARKHRVEPQALPDKHQEIKAQVDKLQRAQQELEHIQQKQALILDSYQAAAAKLSASRQKAAAKLSKAISETMPTLGMQEGHCNIHVQAHAVDQPSLHGMDHIEFLVSTNRGQELQPLGKVASGGEISRISLIIYALTSQQEAASTLIFDEVDVGISGATASVVGRLLSEQAQHTQTLCITHLPQVAAYGQQHLSVHKNSEGSHTYANITTLDKAARIAEIARLLGGTQVTEQTLANAKELCELAQTA